MGFENDLNSLSSSADKDKESEKADKKSIHISSCQSVQE